MQFVKPKKGWTVIDPDTRKKLAAEGAEINTTSCFWVKAIRDGDVEVVVESKRDDKPAQG